MSDRARRRARSALDTAIGLAPPAWAWELGRDCLARLPDKWQHSIRASIQASRLPSVIGQAAVATLQTATILHDIGYSPDLARSGFHPLDGAIFLRSQGVDEEIVSLVAHHSCAAMEAELRGQGEEIGRFDRHRNAELVDAMIWCDMTSGPTGDEVGIDWRICNIRARYGPETVVGQFIDRAEADLRAAIDRVDARRRRARE